MKVLAIETSCDDTSLAVVSFSEGVFRCEHMVAFHQVDLHKAYGGVVPELASREHLNQLIPVFDDLCRRIIGSLDWVGMMDAIDRIVVTAAPGLPGSLVMGRTFALLLSSWFHKPCVFVNHLHGHLLSWLVDREALPFAKKLVLSVSGGHSDLSILTTSGGQFLSTMTDIDNIVFGVQKVASTRDDAIGEVFDKISRLLGGPYPGGVWIGQKAAQCNTQKVQSVYPFAIDRFKRILLADSYDFSFSGMKSQAYTFIQRYRELLNLSQEQQLPELLVSYIAYEFQEAAADIICSRVLQAIDEYDCDSFALVGGVSANARIREKLQEAFDARELLTEKKIERTTPASFEYCTDNAAMIGVAGGVSIYEQ